MKPCIVCGEPSPESRCPDHQPSRIPATTPEARGYDRAWRKLSERARRLQPFCSDCGATSDLQTDHTPEAWERKAAGKSIRLVDVEVVCGPCNRARGSARPGGSPRPDPTATPPGESGSGSHTTACSSSEVV